MFGQTILLEDVMPALPAIANPTLLAIGLLVMVIGFLLRRWASRHNLMTGMAGGLKQAAFDTVRSKGANLQHNPLSDKLHQVAAQGSHTGKAKVAAGFAIKHFLSQAVGIAGWIAMIGGLAMAVAGVFWR
jgi:H+/gluconate symporter-like permease